MTLRLYNSLTRRKEDLRPDDPESVRMYVCGPTVYDYAHIGNARPVIVFDLLFRLLRHLYGENHVVYVRNITDVDDKINARADREKVSIRELTERTAKQFHDDVAALGVLAPTVEPRATGHIAAMVALIERLIARGNAYVAAGHVLFHVPSMPEYGRLSGRSLDEMIAGARVEVAPYKKDATDFVLWKPSPPGLPGWEGPWGRGRPGWHIECSAMAWKHLGERFDIHGGGIDLIFPHHENEIAQSRSAFDTPVMANIWMHNGYLQVEGRKMSKSLGNFVTLNDVLKDWPGEVVRFNMLRTHYRQPMDWTVKGLEESSRVLAGFFSFGKEAGGRSELHEQVATALLDDLNTPEAINRLHELDKAGNAMALTASLRALGFVGNLADPRAPAGDTVKINEFVASRLAARAARNWQESDRIREQLAVMGVVLKDNKDGTTTWEFKR